jgi:hypothetical protein
VGADITSARRITLIAAWPNTSKEAITPRTVSARNWSSSQRNSYPFMIEARELELQLKRKKNPRLAIFRSAAVMSAPLGL